MILTDKKIRKLCNGKEENILISPFFENNLQSESYDLTIGNNIAVLKKELRCIDIRKQEDIDSLYEMKELTSEGFVLSPKEYVLVSLKEKLTLPNNLTAHIRPRTRFTRTGLVVSGQHCNSTYEGILQIGLFNATDNAIKIYPDVRIAQIVFEELEEIPSEDKLYKNKLTAAYQNERDFIGGVVDTELVKEVEKVVSSLLKTGE